MDAVGNMDLGNFSVSLTVLDLDASRRFYEALGFVQVAGVAADGWLVLKNGACKVGLFQGMFERNMLTFNPGWDANSQPVEKFTDIREIQKRLKAAGLTPTVAADEDGKGPTSCIFTDPDGNPVLIDQHI